MAFILIACQQQCGVSVVFCVAGSADIHECVTLKDSLYEGLMSFFVNSSVKTGAGGEECSAERFCLIFYYEEKSSPYLRFFTIFCPLTYIYQEIVPQIHHQPI